MPANNKPLLIAHRGDSQNFPENSMSAFESAFQHGADGVELDVHEHRGELIVVHNYNFDRSASYPKLHDVLERFAGSGRLEIEIKTIGLSFLKPLEKELTPYVEHDIELTTSVAGLIAYLRPAFRNLRLGSIFLDKEFEPWMFEVEENDFYITKVVNSMLLYDADIAHIPYDACTQEMVSTLHANKKRIHTNLAGQTPEKQQEMYSELSVLGVDQVTFDYMGLCNE